MKRNILTAQFSIQCVDDVINSLLAEAVQLSRISIMMTAARASRCLTIRRSSSANEPAVACVDRPIDILASCLASPQAAASIERGGILTTGSMFADLDDLSIKEVSDLADALTKLGISEVEARRYAWEVVEKDAILIGVEVSDDDRDHVRGTITASTRAPRGSRLLC